MIDVRINNGSGWNVESIESQYINISTFPLSGSSYMDLPVESRGPRKGLINSKNKDQKCFLCCHVRHINPSKEHLERIRKIDKNLLSILQIHKKLQKKIKSLLVILIMITLSFPCKKEILTGLKWKTIYALMCLVMRMSYFFQFIFQIKNLKTLWICWF